MSLWSIWCRWNTKLWEGKMETSSMVISGAMSVLNDGQKAMTVLEGNNTAIFEEDNKTGVGLNGFHTSPSCFLSSEDCPLDTLHYMDEL